MRYNKSRKIMKQNIQTSGFSLAKGKELKGDDFFDVKTIGNLSVAVVCDGVGSANKGAEAAKRVTTHLLTNFKNRPVSWSIEKSIKNFTRSINSILYEESMINYERAELVTTLTIVVIDGNRLYGANVGDSRIYLLRDNSLTQLSHDHIIDEDGYEGVLTQAIGISKEVNPYYFENILNKGDKLLLCSDGLYTVMSQEMLQEEMIYGAHYLIKKASKLTKDNLPDDTTAIVLDVKGINPIQELKQQDLIIPKELKNGMLIDGYELKKSLIQNNRTWLCANKSKEYILKFAPIEAIDDPTILDLYVKEAWNSKRLKAGFFPKAVIPKNRTHRYYVMEALNGVDLKTHIKNRHLSVDDTINLAKTLLAMSQYLLKFDLVHGDIKPENIMISKRGDKNIFKIIDFGSMTEIYSTNSTAGTPSYLAPERFSGGSIYEGSEVFSIGVTLYESLTQNYPYGEIEPFQKPIFKTPTLLSKYNKNIPNWLESIIMRSIERDFERRYQKYTEVIFELSNPLKVKPFFDKDKSLIEREPVMVYKVGFIVMFVINISLVLKLIS